MRLQLNICALGEVGIFYEHHISLLQKKILHHLMMRYIKLALLTWWYPEKCNGILDPTYPIWHVDHAFFCNELQDTTMWSPFCCRIMDFKKHRIFNMQRCCRQTKHNCLRTENLLSNACVEKMLNNVRWREVVKCTNLPRRSRADGGIITEKKQSNNHLNF